MTDLVAVSILTGPPQSLSVDTSHLTDDSLITDWQTYFFAADTTITQSQSISVTAILTGQPIVSTTGLIQVYGFQANDLVTGQPVLSDATLTENYPLQADGVLAAQPVVSVAPITEAENFSAVNLISGVPEVDTASITQNNTLLAGDILTGRPVVEDATNPDVILTQEIDQMFGGWQRRTYEVPDGRLVQSEREIQSTYGDVVSIDRKAKSLLKFGKSAELTANTLETVWTVGGNEAYISDDGITHISSSSASDTQEIRVEGHTISGDDLTFVVQLVTLSGQTPVALNTGVARISRISNNSGTELVGRVVAYEDTATSNGLPTDETKYTLIFLWGFNNHLRLRHLSAKKITTL